MGNLISVLSVTVLALNFTPTTGDFIFTLLKIMDLIS